MAAKISFIKQKSSTKLHNDNPVQVSFYEKTAFCQILVYHNKLKKEELLQKMRLASADFVKKAREAKIVNWILSLSTQFTQEEISAFWEGLIISAYGFEKYKTKKSSRIVFEFDKNVGNPSFINKLLSLKEELDTLRNWVNEPFSYLNAETFTKEIKEHCSEYGVSVEVWDKKKIIKQKMSGLLAVNQGSKDEPSFIELTYKPLNASNKKPVVLIGKGVVFDAGGMNIKTENYMTDMKDDMAGAATTACTITLAARLKMPLYIKALIPITDNRLNGNALVPGDIITMRNGATVEIANTDAEGRLLLADAVCYAAEKLQPSLMISVATLTGAASRALGAQGIANGCAFSPCGKNMRRS